MKVIERSLTTEKDGVPGYLAHPERTERGPALLLVHQNTGVTDYIKIEALKFAKLGYTTVVPNLYETYMMEADPHRKSSLGDTMVRRLATVQRRDFDERRKVYSNVLRYLCRIGRG